MIVIFMWKAHICKLYFFSRRIGENLNVSASSVENEPAVSSATQAKEKVGMILLPKPRVPYPRFSRFSQREQRAYVDLLAKYAKIPSSSKAVGTNTNEFLQYLVCILFISYRKESENNSTFYFLSFFFAIVNLLVISLIIRYTHIYRNGKVRTLKCRHFKPSLDFIVCSSGTCSVVRRPYSSSSYIPARAPLQAYCGQFKYILFIYLFTEMIVCWISF